MEQNEIDLLLDKGFEIKTTLFGKPKVWRTKKMTLKRLIELSDVYIKMDLDEKALYSENFQDILAENYKAVQKNARKAAHALAIAVSDGFFYRWWLTNHFLKNITAKELYTYAANLYGQGNYKDFTLSIASLNANRVTKPKAVEKTTG